ncbi:MAG: S-layer homology domain-containing protein [Cetobacterium sp.]|uniref:S-layer homology domain-containing protein n=1 Tax=unclassified Cetobacterium TaxID=2630983 RepID=UPI00163C70A0|nr:S-layer homology domain-containing protein [Cetobacterium sp. 2A]MBC2856206.1 S-layer homology domain-containing protein [Cetobacterium sp. 2A]
MKRFLYLYIFLGVLAYSQEELKFQDVPKEHWAYKAISNLVQKNIIAEDAFEFRGNVPLSRYEFAYNLSKAVNQLQADKADRGDLILLESLVYEFSQELNKIGFDAGTFSGKISNLEIDVNLLRKSIGDNTSSINELNKRIQVLEEKLGN